MKAVYANDTKKGPGHGYLLVHSPGHFAMEDSPRFSIRRSSDQQCLGVEGWQPAEIFLTPDTTNMQDTLLNLHIGPAVVDALDSNETYRITLQSTQGTQERMRLEVSGICYSPASGGQGLGRIQPPQAPVAPLPEPQPTQTPVDPLPEPQPVPTPVLNVPDPLPEQAKTKNKSILLVLGLFLLLAAGGGTAWYLFTKKQAEPSANATPTGPTAEQSPAPQPGPLAQARKHLSGNADPAAGLTLAQSLRAQPEGADAAFLLAEDAATKGNTEAMLLVGDYYDPTTPPSGTIHKEPVQAWNWYIKAQTAGAPGAPDKVKALRAWAEANKNTPEAQHILGEK